MPQNPFQGLRLRYYPIAIPALIVGIVVIRPLSWLHAGLEKVLSKVLP